MTSVHERAVTVIVPHWGDAAPLERALRSILGQTDPVAETIVVDDASPEEYRGDIGACIDAMRADGMAIRVLIMPRNGGPAAARNLGWAEARTEYVAFLDSDDVWHPEKIARQSAVMRETGAAFCGHVYCHNRPMERLGEAYRTYGFRQFLLRNRVSTPAVMLRRDVGPRFPVNQRRSEDYALWLRLAKQAPMVFLEAELARGFKQVWGEGGLSADLKAMTLGQVQTYRGLRDDGLIGPGLVGGLVLWSWLRHLRRVLKQRLGRTRAGAGR